MEKDLTIRKQILMIQEGEWIISLPVGEKEETLQTLKRVVDQFRTVGNSDIPAGWRLDHI